jgi:catabolite regulation protein CreA
MTHYYSGRSGEAIAENTLHDTDDCHHLLNADGGVRPVADSTVEALDDPDYCGVCCDVDDAGDDGDEDIIS